MSNIVLQPNASGTGSITITTPNTNTDRTLNIPDVAGNIVTTGDTGTVTESMISTAASVASATELVTNGTNLTTTAGWSAENAILSVSSGYLNVADDGGYTSGYQAVTTEKGAVYRLQCDVGSISGGNAIISAGDNLPDGTGWGNYGSIGGSSTGSREKTFVARSTTTYIIFGTEGSNSATFGNISLKKLFSPSSADTSLVTKEILNARSGVLQWNTSLTAQATTLGSTGTWIDIAGSGMEMTLTEDNSRALYEWYFNVEGDYNGGAEIYNFGKVQYSTDDGSTWNDLSGSVSNLGSSHDTYSGLFSTFIRFVHIPQLPAGTVIKYKALIWTYTDTTTVVNQQGLGSGPGAPNYMNGNLIELSPTDTRTDS